MALTPAVTLALTSTQDDLLLSPDALLLFWSSAWLLREDPSLWFVPVPMEHPDSNPNPNPKPKPKPKPNQERDYWEARSPIIRFGKYLEAKGWWSADEEAELRKSSRKRAIKSLNDAGKLPANHVKHLYTDVYDEQTWQQIEQKAELKAHLEKCALAPSLTLAPNLP